MRNYDERAEHIAMVLRGAKAAAERRVAMRAKARHTRQMWGSVKHQAALRVRRRAQEEASTPTDALADRDALFAAPRTITAQVFGDPLPGRSALDRRGT